MKPTFSVPVLILFCVGGLAIFFLLLLTFEPGKTLFGQPIYSSLGNLRFTLSGSLVIGESVTLRVEGTPNAMVVMGVAPALAGPFMVGGQSVYLDPTSPGYVEVLRTQLDSVGTAQVAFTVPEVVNPGTPSYVQALEITPSGLYHTTAPLAIRIHPAKPSGTGTSLTIQFTAAYDGIYYTLPFSAPFDWFGAPYQQILIGRYGVIKFVAANQPHLSGYPAYPTSPASSLSTPSEIFSNCAFGGYSTPPDTDPLIAARWDHVVPENGAITAITRNTNGHTSLEIQYSVPEYLQTSLNLYSIVFRDDNTITFYYGTTYAQDGALCIRAGGLSASSTIWRWQPNWCPTSVFAGGAVCADGTSSDVAPNSVLYAPFLNHPQYNSPAWGLFYANQVLPETAVTLKPNPSTGGFTVYV